ncbi:DUF2797 domain-containing protein [Actinomadura barringtoniae]|uniref:DUF2797 domain-containing protein n=1 Tax=Actinomadura barringtoniae TaxID=1427535 RepID=A0A939T3R7_9ACTN|nr:DUF2797 domain-containing protein [Actinomadura barringtoniae]MBO2447114.1 DUF2797 domain-containing protein [Actinomadura barringtoniae]
MAVDGTDTQCASCARADRGRQLARDAVVDVGRTYALYLAWFGSGLLKVGLTAAERGRDRLLEQGAITYTLLATGPYTTVRRAEHVISRAELARERISGNLKIRAWWELPPRAEREEAIRTAYDRLHSRLQWPEGLALTACAPVDQVDDFALAMPPDDFGLVTKVQAAAELVGEVTSLVGRYVLLDSLSGPMLVDMRRIAGWLVGHSQGTEPTGLEITRWTRPGDGQDDQPALF